MTCFWWSIAGFFLVAIVAYRIGMIDGKSIQRLADLREAVKRRRAF